MKLFCYNTDTSGCYWYRLFTPFTKLKEISKDDTFSFDFKIKSIDEIEQYDIVVLQRATDALGIEILEKCKDLHIPAIYEVDDSLFNIVKSNPAAKYYGRADVNYCANYLLEHCDYLTTSTQNLARYYGAYFNKNNIYVLPNSVSLSRPFSLVKINNDERVKPKFRLLITGSSSHKEDWEFLDASFRNLVYGSRGQIDITIFGYVPPAFEGIPNTRVVKPVPVENYFDVLYALKCDLMLTPLADIDFNTYKSNLKFVEAGALSMPLVASNVIAYNQDVVDGVNGWLLPNKPYHWTKLLMKLLRDKSIVKEAGKKARQVVEQKYNLDNTVMDWFNCYNKIMEDFDQPQKAVVLKEEANDSV